MGKEEKRILRAVLDTNVVISAILFKGKISSLMDDWKARRFTFLVSKTILQEYIHVLSYPKFELKEEEIYTILHNHLLPYITVAKEIPKESFQTRDAKDAPFDSCALGAKANYLVSGDRDILDFKFPPHTQQHFLSIITVKEFLQILE